MKSMRRIIFGVTMIALIALSAPQRLGGRSVRIAASTAPVVINFDNLAAGGPGAPAAAPVISQYADKGVTFNGPVALDYSKGLPIPGFARSGNIAIEQCYSQEFCSTPIEMTFTAAQRRVKFWVGFRGRLDLARTVLLRGFDAGGAEVIRATATLPASPGSQPIRTPLEIISASENIIRAAVSFDPTSLFTNGLAVDDVEFDTAGPQPPCAPASAPAVSLSQPVSGSITQLDEFMLQGTLSAPADEAILIVQAGGVTRSLKLLGLISSDGSFGPIRINNMLFPGDNTIYVEAQNCRGVRGAFRTITYEPIAGAARFELMGIEVTQAIQDLSNTVTLIAGKRTVARVYLRLTGSTSEIRNVSGALTACRPLGDSAVCGDFLPNLYSLNTSDIDSSADITARRRDLNASLNFELPPDWITAGRLHLRISRLEIDGATLFLPCDGCDNPAPVTPIFSRFYLFEDAPPVRLQLVSVPYVITSDGAATNPRPVDLNLLTSWLRRAYPTGQVDVTTASSTSFTGLPGSSFSCGDVNGRLAEMRSTDISAGGDKRRKYYGIVFDNMSAMTGGFLRGCAGGNTGSGPAGIPGLPFNPGNSSAWDFDGSYGDWYGGHELGHLYGRDHPDFVINPSSGPACIAGVQDGTGPDKGYPFTNGFLSNSDFRFFGFDIGDASLGIAQQVYDPAIWTDMMTYCANEWISSYTYESVLAKLRDIEASGSFAPRTEETEAQLSDGLLVQGTINLMRNSVTLSPFLRLAGLRVTSRPATSDFSIDLLNSAGALLARYPFEPQRQADVPINEDPIALLSEVVPYATGASRIVILKNGVELASRAVSANAPRTQVLSPNGGESLAGATVTVTWQGSDADGDQLTYSLLYSADAGQTWRTLAVRLTQPGYDVSLATLPGSQRALFRVIATDGVNTAMDDSDAIFNAPLKNPQVSIIAPTSQSRFTTTQTIVFTGMASDLEDGALDGAALQWSSNRQGSLGLGRSIAVSGLAPGAHIITLEARDQSGGGARANIQLTITAPAPVADAGPDQRVTVGGAAQFDGRNSRGFGNLSYQWTLLSKPAGSQAALSGASTAQPTFTGDVMGNYVAQLVIQDATGAQAVDRAVVTVTCCGLTILARQDTGADLTASLNVTTPALGARVTPFNLSLPAGDRLAVIAPAIIGNLRFLHWRSVTNNRVLTTSATLIGSVDRNETLAAIYRLPATVTFSVNSICEGCVTGPAQFPGLTVNVIAPALGARVTPFSFDTALDSRALITAPATVVTGGRTLRFKHWISVTDNRVITAHRALSGHIDKTETVAAVYQP